MAQSYKDIYIKYPGYPGYIEGQIETDSKFDLVLNKLGMILFTNQGDCIADPEFGANLEFYLWQTRVSVERIQSVIETQIQNYIPELNSNEYSLNVSITKGTLRDILFIDIKLRQGRLRAVLN